MPKISQKSNSENIHKNHRERMRAKFEISGFSGMADHEILEFMLFYAIPLKDTNPIAHRILERFQTLERVFGAELNELKTIDGVGEKTAVYIKAIGELFKNVRKRSLRKGQALSTVKLASEYLIDFFINESNEKMYAFFLDKGDRLISYKMLFEGSVDSIAFDEADIVREAAITRCSSVIISHNHPGGHIEASYADISATRKISRALECIHVTLKDHIIIAGENYFSMREKSGIA